MSAPAVLKREKERCSFCGRPVGEVRLLLTGKDGARICDRCVRKLHAEVAPGKGRA